MSSVRSGDLVRFVPKEHRLEKAMFPENDKSVYLVISDPKMKVFTAGQGETSYETLSVEIMCGTRVQTVPVNLLERTERLKKGRRNGES